MTKKKKKNKKPGPKKLNMSQEDQDLARKVIYKIRQYHKNTIPGWKAIVRNDIYTLLKPKLERWVYSFFNKKFIKLSDQKKLSLTYELFADILEKFRVDKSRTPIKNFFVNMHQLILWRLIALHNKWEKERQLRNEEIDPDSLPDNSSPTSSEMTFEFHEFLRGLESEDEEIAREVKKILKGEYEKFQGNVYKFGKERTHRKWFYFIMKYLCTTKKWGEKE